MDAAAVKKALQQYASAEDAVFLQGFFKTGPGQYGEGDVFIGVRVPKTRAVCKQFSALPLPEVQKLLDDEVHEYRLAALIIMTLQYPKADARRQNQLFEMYVSNVRSGRINNWDLVDTSAEFIVGPYLYGRPKDLLYELAKSSDVWQRRVSVLSTFAYIKKGEPEITLELAEILLHDQHDLLQKAVGWMLREIGKRIDENLLTAFLEHHAHEMPRTMLRYAIERLSPEQRAYYMKLK